MARCNLCETEHRVGGECLRTPAYLALEAELYQTKIKLDQREFTLQNTFNHWQEAKNELEQVKASFVHNHQEGLLSYNGETWCTLSAYDKTRKELTAANERAKGLVEALEFYADSEVRDISGDLSEKAREALLKYKGEE